MPEPPVVIIDIVSVAGPMLMRDRTACRRRAVRWDVSFMRVRALSVLCPGRRGARDGKDETSNESSHVPFPLLAIVLTKRTIERHHEMKHAECQTVISIGVSNHACDVCTGAAAVALVHRRSQMVSVRGRVQRLHAAVASVPSGSSR